MLGGEVPEAGGHRGGREGDGEEEAGGGYYAQQGQTNSTRRNRIFFNIFTRK